MPEQVSPDPKHALGTGYGESKWVSERLLQIVREKTPVKTMVIRVGQLAGSRINGNWNTAEWFPAIVQSYKSVGCLPDGTGVRFLFYYIYNFHLTVLKIRLYLGYQLISRPLQSSSCTLPWFQ